MNVFDVLRERLSKASKTMMPVIPTNEALEIVNQVEQEVGISKMENGWISCNEKLPEKNIFVLASMRDGHMYVVKHVDKVRVGIFECEWKTLGSYFGTEDVLAWQPLPEPYKEV